MRRLIYGIVLGLFVTPLVFYVMAVWLPTKAVDPARWIGDCMVAKAAVAEHEAKPQILILAGSNALYGFSADYLLQHDHLRSTNLGTHAGLGLRYILTYGLNLAKRGDLIVVPVEYSLYGPERYDNASSLQILVNDKPYFYSLGWRDRALLIANISTSEWAAFARNRIKADPVRQMGCLVSTLSPRGDQTSNIRGTVNAAVREKLAHFTALETVLDERAKADLLWFKDETGKRGIRFVLAYPNILDRAFNAEQSATFLNDLQKFAAANDIPLIGKPADRVFALEESYDTEYHSDNLRQIENTKILLRQLSGYDLSAYRD